MRIWRIPLRLSAELHNTSDIQVIDAANRDRVAASQRYAKRTNYTFEAVKATTLIDCKAGMILYTLHDETTARFQDRLADDQIYSRQTEQSHR